MTSNDDYKWISTIEASEVIFISNDYLWNELLYKKEHKFVLKRHLFYKIDYENLKKARKGRVLQLLSILHQQNDIQTMPPKVKKITKKETKLNQRN